MSGGVNQHANMKGRTVLSSALRGRNGLTFQGVRSSYPVSVTEQKSGSLLLYDGA